MITNNVEIKPLVIKTQKTTESLVAFRCTLNPYGGLNLSANLIRSEGLSPLQLQVMHSIW